MNTLKLSDFPEGIQQSFVEYDILPVNVFDEDDDCLKKGTFEEKFKRKKKSKPHEVDYFSKLSDEKLKLFAKKTVKSKLARFLDHPGISADGTPVSEIVKEELERKAIQDQQVKEIQGYAVDPARASLRYQDCERNLWQQGFFVSDPKRRRRSLSQAGRVQVRAR